MLRSLTPLTAAALAAVALTAVVLTASAQAAPAKVMPGKIAAGRMVSLYQADKCQMYFTPAQAKTDHYACPDSKGKMHLVKMTAAAAKKALTPKKAM